MGDRLLKIRFFCCSYNYSCIISFVLVSLCSHHYLFHCIALMTFVGCCWQLAAGRRTNLAYLTRLSEPALRLWRYQQKKDPTLLRGRI